jgi:uncharacterized membrane protein
MLEDEKQGTRPAPAPAAAVGATDADPRPVRHDRVPWLIALAVFCAYFTISLYRYLQLNPGSWDLGIYTEYVKQYAHLKAPIVDLRGAGVNLLGDHFQPIVGLISPFFRIVPSPATLLAAQALLTAVSVIPVSRAAAAKLGTGAGRAIGAAYGFSWGLQQMIDFDFHEIAFAVPLLAFSLSALVRGRTRAAVAWALPLVFVKEDQGFTVAAIGLIMIIFSPRFVGDGSSGDSESAERAGIRGGQFLMVWGMAWSVAAITLIIPHLNASHHYQYWSDGGALSPVGGHFTVTHLVGQTLHAWPDKLQTIVMLLLPTAFIALGSPIALVTLPSLVLRFVSTNSSYWGTTWHYNATVMPILFIAAIDAMARIRAAKAATTGDTAADFADDAEFGLRARLRQRARPLMLAADRHGTAIMLALAVPLALQFPLNNLWNAQTYSISPRVAADNAAMAKVPDGARVQTTLDLLAPLGARTDTFWIGNAGNPDTEYIVFDGTNSGYSIAPGAVPGFIAQSHPNVTYKQIFEDDYVYVFRLAGKATGG